jgi:outer membrane protein OmpA-like peptidoglycan-associated protein
MKTISTRHELNPSFQPLTKGYFALPVFPGIYFGVGVNSLALEDIIYPKNNKTIWFYDKDNGGNIDDFYKRLKSNINIYTEADIRLFGLGFKLPHNSYLTIGLDTKVNAGVFLPKDFAKLAVEGGNSFDFSGLGVRTNVYHELAVGYSREINTKLTVGGKVKLLLGHANVTTKFNKFKLDISKEHVALDIKGTANVSAPGVEYELDEKGNFKNINSDDMFDNFSFGKLVGGNGFAFDLGANYKLLNDRLTLSASVLDLGFIKWKAQNAANISASGSVDIESLGSIKIEDGDAKWTSDPQIENIEDYLNYNTNLNSGYTSALAAKVYIGAEYGLIKNALTFGALSKSTIINKTIIQDLTASINYLQVKWFNASLSYSVLNGRFGTFGLGLGGRLGPLNMYLVSDYLPTHFTKQYIPYKSKAFNLQLGLVFNVGYKKPRPPKIKIKPEIQEVKKEIPPVQKETPVIQEEAPAIQEETPAIQEETPAIPAPPVVQELPVQAEPVQKITNIEFDNNKSIIKPQYNNELDKVVDILTTHPNASVIVSGHSDNTFTKERNMEVSKKRAEIVKTYLVNKKISAERISVEYYGFDKPIADNNTDEGRAKNRRAEITIVYK